MDITEKLNNFSVVGLTLFGLAAILLLIGYFKPAGVDWGSLAKSLTFSGIVLALVTFGLDQFAAAARDKHIDDSLTTEATSNRLREAQVQKFIAALRNYDNKNLLRFFPHFSTVELSTDDFDLIVTALHQRQLFRQNDRIIDGDPYYHEAYEKELFIVLHDQHKSLVFKDRRMNISLVRNSEFTSVIDYRLEHAQASFDLLIQEYDAETVHRFRSVAGLLGPLRSSKNAKYGDWKAILKAVINTNPDQIDLINRILTDDFDQTNLSKSWGGDDRYEPGKRDAAVQYVNQLTGQSKLSNVR